MVSILENLTLEDIEQAFGKELLRQGESFYDAGAVIDLGFEKNDNSLWGVIEDRHNEYRAQVNFESERILIQCECGNVKPGQPCAHVITLLVLLTRNRDILMGEGRETNESIDQLLTPVSQQAILSHPSNLMTLEDTEADYRARLSALTIGHLREIAGLRGVKISGQRREGIVNALAEGLAKPENLQTAVGKLSREAHLVLDLLLILGEDLERIHISTVFHWLEAALTEREPGIGVQDQVNTLVRTGFVFASDVHLYLPKAMTSFHEQNPALVGTYNGIIEKPEKQLPGDFTRQALWLILLSQTAALESSPPTKNKDYGGWPSLETPGKSGRETSVLPFGFYIKSDVLRRLAPLIGQSTEKIDYIARLLTQAGLWKPDAPKELIPFFSRWLKEGPERQYRDLLEAAKSLEVPVELDRAREAGSFKVLRDAYLHFPYQYFLQGLLKARQIFFRVLMFLPGDVWIDMESVLRLVHGLVPDFIPENNNNRQLWLELKDGPVRSNDFVAWQKSYGLFYQAIVEGTLFWLGMCEVLKQEQRLVAFKLTPFGEFLIGNRDDFKFEPVRASLASISFPKDDLIEINPAQATPETIILVMLLGKIEPAHGSKIDPKGTLFLQSLYCRVQNDGLGRVFEAGWTADRLQKELRAASKQPLPVNLADRIRVCWERYGRLHIYTDMALIQFGDDYCLPELLAGTHLGQHLLYQFNPRLIAVLPEKVEEILGELRSKGYTPRLMEQKRG